MSEELAVKPKRWSSRRHEDRSTVIEVPVHLRVSAKQREQLDALAAERGVSMSAVIREALDQVLNQVPMCGDAR
jgi:predicted HicB family RNase H-like nuclease